MKQMLCTLLVFGIILTGCGQSTAPQASQERHEQPTPLSATELLASSTISPQPPTDSIAEATAMSITQEPLDGEEPGAATTEPLERAITQALSTEAPIEPVPESMPTTPEASDAEPTATPYVGDPIERLQTAVPVPNPDPAQIETIPIYGIGEAAGGQGQEGYARDVIETTSADLATRLSVSVDAVVVVRGSYGEVQSMAPCGTSAKDSEQPIGDGMEFGYEVVYDVSGMMYRYIGVGGLAYYCGAE